MFRKFWQAFIVTFILLFMCEWFLHNRLMMGIYAGAQSIILPQEMMLSRMMWMMLGYFFLAIFWTYLFMRFCIVKNWVKGALWGLGIVIFYKVPNALIWYAILPLSGWAHLWNITGGIIEGIVIGVVMGIMLQEK